MPVFRLDERLIFPPASLAEDGLIAVGGDLRPERLVLAYRSGIFPWYEAGQPILWHSPDPRMVLSLPDLHVPSSLEKTMRRRPFRLTIDTAFSDVIAACASTKRPGQRTTWITPQMRRAYVQLHERGLAHSVETWRDGRLVGGLYGVALGRVFFGESMFARSADASKIAFVALARQLERWGFEMIDCQVYTHHLHRFGARQWPRRVYLRRLARAAEAAGRPGRWSFDPEVLAATSA